MVNLRHIVALGMVMTFAGPARADTIRDCTVAMEGALRTTGDEITGTLSDIGGVEVIDFTLRAPGLVFETDALAPGDSSAFDDEIQCRDDSAAPIAIVESYGTGTVNGVPGYHYLLEVFDHRGTAPDVIPLSARLIYVPTHEREDAKLAFASPRTVIIPPALPVTMGSAGDGSARLRLDHQTCRYKGDGSGNYAFERCTGPDGPGLMPGEALDVTHVELRVQSADRTAPVTVVQIDNLGTGLIEGTPDTFLLTVIDIEGEPALFYESNPLHSGDIDVTFLP